ncbi:MAG: lysophospholipase [Spirochaetales bacterium]|jgi:alpha-beta hydrolase superfamily lysophospholipase|nr:lysophospholipase [Spirochaetales bacterium]
MALKSESGTFLSSEKRTSIVYTRWFDDAAPPKAILLIAHGMSEYAGRYGDFAGFMVQKGWAVYGNDHLGHGKTAAPEDRGYLSGKGGRHYLVEDMRTLLKKAKEDFPGVKVIFLGHSMGSFIARLFCMKYSQEIDGAIFMGTCGPNPISGAGVFIANIIAFFKGERYRSPFYTRLLMGPYNNYPNPKTPFDWLNTDEEEVQKYMADELAGFPWTMSGYRELCKMIIEINRPGWAGSIRKDLPILVISGEEDPVGSAKGQGVKAVYQTLQEAGLSRVDLILYPEMRHEILNEKDKQKVYNDILGWTQDKV